MAKTDNKNPLVRQQNFVVAIGASAGGLEAIQDFFDNVPDNTNFTFIIIQHLSPDYKSLLVELLSKHTNMAVLEAKDGEEVQRNCVYVIPNKKVMTISRGRLVLDDKVAERAPNTTIDSFLLSLAKDRKQRSVAVILSGTGTDGTRGAEAVKNAGGLVMVQDPATARFDGMPNSVIATGCADFILPPELMPGEMHSYIREAPLQSLRSGKLDERLMEEVFKMVYRYTGCDFSSYKEATILRRIARRLAQLNIKRFEDYVSYLHSHPQEAKLLGKDFLIGVTRFFRDTAAFQLLENEVFPQIIASKQEEDPIKIWATACSTGEEVYSIAITLDRLLKKTGKNFVVKIFASDVDEHAVDYASRAVYPASIAKDVPQDILDEYFVKQGKKYQVRADIRKQIVFAKQNIVKDPPFIRNDLISCRNMLIYMNAPLQKKILTTLHFSLNTNGFLLLGPSETISILSDDLKEINRKWKIYRKKEGSASVMGMTPMGNHDHARLATRYTPPGLGRSKERTLLSNLQDDFCSVLCEDNGYAAMYIDKNYMVKEATGNFKKFLSLPEKSLNLNLIKMVSGDMAIALNTAIRRASKENQKVMLERVKIRDLEIPMTVTIWVKPGVEGSSNPYTLLVLREEVNTTKELSAATNGKATVKEIPEKEYVAELQAELRETKSNLQAAIESLESANEEMQASNEELLSANEELQSSNEELQSLNEELHTLNTEHQAKIHELLELNDDLNNYFRSTDIGKIMLDRNLRIRKFNPAAVKLVNLIDSDIGRPIGHISTNLRYDSLVQDVQAVISTRTTLEQEVELNNSKSYLMRIFPYVRQDKQVDGAVVTFVDITEKKQAEERLQRHYNELMATKDQLKKLNEELELKVIERTLELSFLAESMPLMVWTAKPDGEVEFFNRHFEHFTGMPLNEAKGKGWKKVLHEESLQELAMVGKEAIELRKDFSLEIMIRRHDGEYRWHLLRARARKDAHNNLQMWVGTNTDIHEQKMANRLLEQRVHERTLELQRANKELASSNDELQQFASVASHDLKEPLRKIYMFSNMLKENHFQNEGSAQLYIERIINSSERMIQLVNDLLSFSRLSVESTFENMDLNIVLNEVLADLELTIQEKKATLEIDELPKADVLPGQIRQVFQNILSNALKFSKPDVPCFISIGADMVQDKNADSPVDENGQWVRISIRDNGIGFNEKYLPKIFTIFQRLHTRKEYDGTGIGLAICKKIVEKHGGLITATSVENEGSTFIMVLPLKQKAGLTPGKSVFDTYSPITQ
jgi:two-component system CheB/CheR fusion protein